MGEDTQPLLKIGLPKGSLETPTVELFDRAGYNINIRSRSYTPEIDDPQMSCVMFRAQEMARYVEDGVIDIGITGHDWVVENDADVHEVCELAYSRATGRPVRWVLAVPEEGGIDDPKQLEGKIISTELINTTQRYFEEQGINVRKVEFSWGATEVKARLVDAIVDVTETGSSLRANNLKVIATLLTSTTRLIANKQSWENPEKRKKIEDLAMLLQGAIAARTKVGLKMNIPRANLDEILSLLQAEHSPTINDLADSGWAAVEVITDEKIERDLIPQLKRAGATGLVSYPLNKVIP
ncbi:MAG: ATP phosphoribosyltransferase [Phycisphaeraceae bacterium]|jgi:ATP phosphoribosyltransferase